LLIKDFTFPSPLKTKISLKAILEEKPDIKEIKREDIFMNAEKVYLEEENIPNRPIQIGRISKGRQGERIYHPNGHAITLSAYGGGIGAKTGIYKVDNKLRKLTPRECARAQGFPESFKIISSNSQAYKQFGNSVAINVLDSILSTIEIKLDTINNSEPLLLSE
jgi:DNA (cytosine-5)-methyltransferase 1